MDLDSEKRWRLKMETVWIHLHRRASVSWDRVHHQRGNTEIKNNASLVEWSSKASGHEFSPQKIHKFAKNVTWFTFPKLNLSTSNSHFPLKAEKLVNKFQVISVLSDLLTISPYLCVTPGRHLSPWRHTWDQSISGNGASNPELSEWVELFLFDFHAPEIGFIHLFMQDTMRLPFPLGCLSSFTWPYVTTRSASSPSSSFCLLENTDASIAKGECLRLPEALSKKLYPKQPFAFPWYWNSELA